MRLNFNQNFDKMEKRYLFSEIAERVADYKKRHSDERLISLGIGDVTLPIAPCVSEEMARAARDLSTREGFLGYGDTRGLLALRGAISARYLARDIKISEDEIFINDGSKSDLGNIFDIFGDVEVLIPSPAYPVYLDACTMSGKRARILKTSLENGFLPSPEGLEARPFVIFLCSPNNPTGVTFSKNELSDWVEFALGSGSLIIFDAAYEGFVRGADVPRSIFEIDGARDCSIEICSLSKNAGFTGIRCGWCAIPKNLSPVHELWARRQATKFNGASYVAQRGALAALSPEGECESLNRCNYYLENAKILAAALQERGIWFVGGENSPYLWLKCYQSMKSWAFFDFLLERAGIIGTPGVGFGEGGEGYFRFSSFAPRVDVLIASERLRKIL